MNVLDVINSPWAITAEMLRQIQSIYLSHTLGQQANLGDIEAKIGKPLNNSQQEYEVSDGVAIIPVRGPIAKKMNLFSRISGGSSTELVANEIKAALADFKVHSIILHMDTPGGTVDGTAELAGLVYDSRSEKKIVTLVDGLMASAGVWIGSAATEVYLQSKTAVAGSIGVVSQHVDVSKMEEQQGRKTTEIYAGKYKRIDSAYEPLSKEARDYRQTEVDYLYSLFVDDVSKHYGLSTEKVVSDMADGRLFTGQQAVDAGLAKGVMSLESLVDKLNGDNRSSKFKTTAVISKQQSTQEVSNMDLSDLTAEQLAENRADLAEHFRAEGRQQGQQSGAEAERQRIQGVLDHSMAGHEDFINTLAFDGQTTPESAASQVLKAEKKKQANINREIHGSAPEAVPTSVDGYDGQEGNAPTQLSAVQLANKAQALIAKKAQAGITISTADAVNQIQSGEKHDE